MQVDRLYKRHTVAPRSSGSIGTRDEGKDSDSQVSDARFVRDSVQRNGPGEPRSNIAVGQIQYLSHMVRYDVAHAVSRLGQYNQ